MQKTILLPGGRMGAAAPAKAGKTHFGAKAALPSAKNRKIRAIAHFNTLKTYKSAKKFFLFLVRLSGGLRLLYERNLLL